MPATSSARTPWGLAAWWCALLALHWLCFCYYIGFAIAYRNLPKSNLAFQFRTYSIGIAETEYATIQQIHEAVAAIHGVFILLMLLGSIQRRKLVYYPRWRLIWYRLKAKVRRHQPRGRRVSDSLRSQRASSRLSSLASFTASWRRVGSKIFGRKGLLGVDFVYFDHVLLVRELVETALQTYQAFRMTRLLPRLWLIRVYVALLVANCWVVPVLHRVYLHARRRRRMLSLVCDVVLDVIASMGISLLILCSYMPQYTDPRFGFSFNSWYDDKWFVSVLQEFQMMVVVSWGDMASRLVFAFGVLQCIESLKDMLKPDLRRESAAASLRKRGTTTNLVGPDPVPLERLSTGPTLSEAETTSRSSRGGSVVQFILHVVGPTAFVLWGFAILGIHVYAESQRIDLPCQLPLRPWFNRAPACSLVEIDCNRLGASGNLTSLATTWTVFDPALTAGLVVRHCPELEISSSITHFTSLTTMKTYNSTISAWPSDAGLAAASHARFRALYLIRTNLTQGKLPPGLLRKDFPQTFKSFITSVTNLQTLPDNLHQLWPKRMAIAIEYAGLTSIPDVVLKLSPGMISVSQNPIVSVPAELFQIPTLGNLLLSYTNLQDLPTNVTKLAPRLYLVFVEGTNISTFWSWMDPFITRSLSYNKGFFNAHGTPFCEERTQILNGTRDRFSTWSSNESTPRASIMDVASPSRLAYTAAAVACRSDFRMLFPLWVQDATSAIG